MSVQFLPTSPLVAGIIPYPTKKFLGGKKSADKSTKTFLPIYEQISPLTEFCTQPRISVSI